MNRTFTLFETELGEVKINANYESKIKRFPYRIEECHGTHLISEDEEDIELLSLELIVPKGEPINLIPLLSEEQIDYIIDNLND